MRYELSDYEWTAIKPMLPDKPRGVRRVNDRRVLNGIFWVLRSGAPWRDLPENYGPYTTCYNRFVRWRQAGIWDKIMDAMAAAHDGTVQRIDTSVVLSSSGVFAMKDKYVVETDLTTPGSKPYIQLELDPEELQAIGHVAAQWAFLEYHIHAYTVIVSRHILNQEPPREAENDSFRRRKIAWESVARDAFKDKQAELDIIVSIIERAGSLQGQRHKLLHGLLEWDEANKDTINVFSRKNPHGAPWNVDAKRIERLAREIATLNADFICAHADDPRFNQDDEFYYVSSPRRPGTPIRAGLPPDHEGPLKAILETRKDQK